MTYSIRGWLGTVVRLVLGVVWIWSGWTKLHSPRHFLQTVRAYDVVPEWLAKAIGFGLPVLEVALGVLLVIGIATRIAAWVSAGLLVVFLVGLIEVSVRGIHLRSGLFGVGGLTVQSTHYGLYILLAAVLLVAAVFLALWPMTRLSLEEYLARHDYVEPPSAKRMRSEQGQRKYYAQVEVKQREARVRDRYVNASLAIVVALVVVIGIGVQSGRASISGDPSTANVSARYGVVYGKVAAARVDIYEDFHCVQCREFAQAVDPTLEADVKANRAQVHYYPLALLDSSSNGNRYSSRAANAAVCVADDGVDAYVKYRDVLFGNDSKGNPNQPGSGQGRTDDQLVQYAQQAGLTPTQVTNLTACVDAEQYSTLVQAITETASRRGVNGVPTVKVNGRTLAHPGLSSLEAAIAAADAKGPAPKPSPTPKPSPSKSAPASAAVSASKTPAKAAATVTPKPSPAGSPKASASPAR